jgi:hypothetical protein
MRIIASIVIWIGGTALTAWLDKQHVPSWVLLAVAITAFSLGAVLMAWPWLSKKWRQWRDKSDNKDDLPLPDKRPKVVATRFDKDTAGLGLTGLYVANDGEPAYEVSLPAISIGHKTKIETNRKHTRLVAGSEVFFPIWLEEEGLPGHTGEMLFYWMRDKNEDSITIPIIYTAEGVAYETRVTLERNVESPGGLDIQSKQKRRK